MGGRGERSKSGLGRSKLLRLVAEELETVLSPGTAKALLRRCLDAEGVDVADAESLLVFVHKKLRNELSTTIRPQEADALADRIADVLMPHVRSGIRKKSPPKETPIVTQAEMPISVGVVLGADVTLRDSLVASLTKVGVSAISMGPARALSATPAARWVDAFLVGSDLPAAEVRELAWWTTHREQPCVVVVWPVGDWHALWASAVRGAVVLGHADVELLAATLVDLVGDLRERAQ